jgi:hypothetical protein
MFKMKGFNICCGEGENRPRRRFHDRTSQGNHEGNNMLAWNAKATVEAADICSGPVKQACMFSDLNSRNQVNQFTATT